jgi:hypothetical protein
LSNETVPIVAEIIRSKSRSGELIGKDEIFQDLLNRSLLMGDKDEAQRRCKAIIESALEEHEDLLKLDAVGGEQHFFSSRFMSEAYARILLKKGSDPLSLIAEIVLQDSAIYPRPTPLDTFGYSPFYLTREEIQDSLNRMAGQDEYHDIEQTMSSIGTVFLYSTLHLEPGYASMLAEWVDLGQANNP